MGNYIEEYRAQTPGSAKLYGRAEKIMPGGTSQNTRYFAPEDFLATGWKWVDSSPLVSPHPRIFPSGTTRI
jgi:hypothetical protein